MLRGAENTNDVREMVLLWVIALAGSGESFRKVIYKETLALVLVKRMMRRARDITDSYSTHQPLGTVPPFSPKLCFRHGAVGHVSFRIKHHQSVTAVVNSLSKGNIENINGGDLHILRAEGSESAWPSSESDVVH